MLSVLIISVAIAVYVTMLAFFIVRLVGVTDDKVAVVWCFLICLWIVTPAVYFTMNFETEPVQVEVVTDARTKNR